MPANGDLEGLLNSIISDSHTRDVLTGSREVVPPPQPGLAAPAPTRHEGNPCGFATRVLSPPLWTLGSQGTSQLGDSTPVWRVISQTLVPAGNGGLSGKGKSHIGGVSPGVQTTSSPSTSAILPGDTVSSPAGSNVDPYATDYEPAGGDAGYDGGSDPDTY